MVKIVIACNERQNIAGGGELKADYYIIIRD